VAISQAELLVQVGGVFGVGLLVEQLLQTSIRIKQTEKASCYFRLKDNAAINTSIMVIKRANNVKRSLTYAKYAGKQLSTGLQTVPKY
jgi:hypothetical protein